MEITFKNIKTNNLKGIDYTIIEKGVNALIGKSGSGKSSLAFDTIANLCSDEYEKISGTYNEKGTYDLENYGKLLVPISLKQLNFNRNPRSTIGTYYNLDIPIKRLFTEKYSLPLQDFSFNKMKSMCKTCSGLGYINQPDESRIIEYNTQLKDNPFLPWHNTMKNYYDQLLERTISEYGIDENKKFYELPEEQRKFLLYGFGENKYKINYKQSGRRRVKTSTYIGVLEDIKKEISKNKALSDKYAKNMLCPNCKGSRLSVQINKYQINGLNIGQYLSMDITELHKIIQNSGDKKLSQNLLPRLQNIIDLELGYLNLNRSISTLSGGELQRLQLSELLNSKFINLLIILDEPLSSLHINEENIILERISLLKKNNTLLIVDHSEKLLSISDQITTLGPSGGIYGGKIINTDDYLEEQQSYKIKLINYKNSGSPIDYESFTITNSEIINNFKSCDILVPKNRLIGISGYSGSGKSTFLRDIVPKNIPNYKYISQDPILGNIYSTVGSYLAILADIRLLFAKENNLPQAFFSYHFSGEGKCEVCNGTGEIKTNGNNFLPTAHVCPECDGKRYNKKVLGFEYKDMNIYEFLNKTIDELLLELADDEITKKSKLLNVLESASRLSLGHLKLIQKTSTLSGGENQRIKILGNLNVNSDNEIIGLDEPFKGLDNENVFNLVSFFKHLIEEKRWSIFFIDHNVLALNVCDYLIDIGPRGGKDGGRIIYNGSLDKAKENKQISIYDKLVKL